ncbi:hypothetical protein AAFF_G00391610 [Aldrovandia affinis]|uniref:Uncharacterized protein n=1 Tax=Aldrovandia affinis TaxID=143900 RepID=A0AAD7SEI2_9TELE|nr:hypothetical protein AAFF_G00391610 [Aldrovandia affinis]
MSWDGAWRKAVCVVRFPVDPLTFSSVSWRKRGCGACFFGVLLRTGSHMTVAFICAPSVARVQGWSTASLKTFSPPDKEPISRSPSDTFKALTSSGDPHIR